MILKNTEEKIKFLEECLSHINRIFSIITNNKEKLPLTLDNNYADMPGTAKLPISVTLKGTIPKNNYDVGKLMVLTSLYNQVATSLEEDNSVDLQKKFDQVKQELHYSLLDKGLPGADELMKKYKHHFLKEGVMGFILSFIWTKRSSDFLDKYEFFTKKTNWEDDFNFRYELANNCHFDVNKISKIEPIGMGSGYVIKAKTPEDASIIMQAIRKELSKQKLEDSIRFIDQDDLSPKNEGSSSIEIWGQAVSMLNDLLHKSHDRFH